jgi:hypothetical protein
MEGMKRPWEDDGPTDLQFKRRQSTNDAAFASEIQQPFPHPQGAGLYSRDLRDVNQRRLPPLYAPSYSESAERTTAHSLLVAAQRKPVPSSYDRPRSQSLFNVIRDPHWQDQERNIGTNPPTSFFPRLFDHTVLKRGPREDWRATPSACSEVESSVLFM